MSGGYLSPGWWQIAKIGDAAVTLRAMASKVRKDLGDQWGTRQARHIVRNIGARNTAAQVNAIREFLDERFQFIRDPKGLELLRSPLELLHEIAEQGSAMDDCDGAATLGAYLAQSIGIPAFFEARGYAVQNAPFAHVVTRAGRSGEWELDTTRPWGYNPPPITRRLTVEV